MVKIVIKKEGATQSCGKCGTSLICRMKDYGGNFAPTLQWQNFDGNAHFKTTDGKNYACNVPDEEEATQTRIPSSSTNRVTTDSPSKSIFDIAMKDTLDNIDLRLQRMDEMVQAIFRYIVDRQLEKK